MVEQFGNNTLSDRIRSRTTASLDGLGIHYLEAGFEKLNQPLILLLHGFPELAYSWRKSMVLLADAGFHVVAPDQRGFGGTVGWNSSYDQPLRRFSQTNLVIDVFNFISHLGYESVASIIGHDFGSSVAGWSALIRPDIFESVVLMSAPFVGPYGRSLYSKNPLNENNIEHSLASLERPRKHYGDYFCTDHANTDMMNAEDGLNSFLRAYFHMKSDDWEGNSPFELKSWTAEELSKMPTYYIMDLDQNMPQTVKVHKPSKLDIELCDWLPDTELKVFETEFQRTGFQGGLNWYRATKSSENIRQLALFHGRKIVIPSLFIAGKSDWGPLQNPGALKFMEEEVCMNFYGTNFVNDAGHWVQQEQPNVVSDRVLSFLNQVM